MLRRAPEVPHLVRICQDTSRDVCTHTAGGAMSIYEMLLKDTVLSCQQEEGSFAEVFVAINIYNICS